MKKIFSIALILVLTTCLSEYTVERPIINYGFQDYTLSSFVNNFPQYPLNANAGDTIDIHIKLIDPAPGVTLDDLGISLMGTNGQVQQAPAFTGGLLQASLAFTVTLSAGAALICICGGCQNSVNVFQLEVKVNGVSTLKVADMLRFGSSHLVYLKNPAPLQISGERLMQNAINNIGVYELTDNIPNQVYYSQPSISETGTFQIQTPTVTTPYALVNWLYFPASQPEANAAITFQSDRYPCPYSKGFIDYHGTFAPCSHYGKPSQPNPNRPPTCGKRQYAFNGSCRNVNPYCDKFDPHNGDCITCWANRPAVRGKCPTNSPLPIHPARTCSPDALVPQFKRCIPNKCETALPDGTCLACVNTAFTLDNGECVEVDCGVGSYFSVAENSCVPVPDGCLTVNPVLQACVECASGKYPNPMTRQCKSICKDGKYFINNHCVPLPPHCLSLTPVLHCDSCEEGYKVLGEVCVPE